MCYYTSNVQAGSNGEDPGGGLYNPLVSIEDQQSIGRDPRGLFISLSPEFCFNVVLPLGVLGPDLIRVRPTRMSLSP